MRRRRTPADEYAARVTRGHMRLAYLVILMTATTVTGPVLTQEFVFPEDTDRNCSFAIRPPDLEYAPVALVMDSATGDILYGRNVDEPRIPASLTKLVTIYTALEASRSGDFLLDEPRKVHPRAFADAMPPGSSLMFLGSGQFVDGWDLLRGLAVSSGNDASVEVAIRISGSVSAFAGLMNATVRSLGFSRMYFEEAAGLSPGNRITAREMASFTRILLEEWPQTLEQLFALRGFRYPEARHYPESALQGGTIYQQNRNTLLDSYPGADGLKTGYTGAAGYNLVASASRDDRRLIVVLLGIDAADHSDGARRRTKDATVLLDWGFEEFDTLFPVRPDPGTITVWGGRVRSSLLSVDKPPPITLPRDATASLRGSIEVSDSVWAPLEAGTQVGTVRYFRGECLVSEVPVRIAEGVEKGGILRRIWDYLRWWLRETVNRG